MAKPQHPVDTQDITRRITRTPFPGSRKVYLGQSSGLRVPFREISLSDTLIEQANGPARHEPNGCESPSWALFTRSLQATPPH